MSDDIVDVASFRLLLRSWASLTHSEELLEVVQQRPVVPATVSLPVLARVREQDAQSVGLLLKMI